MSYPLYINNVSSIVLRVHSPVSMDTQSGDIFQPQHCIGHNPMVCRKGPVYQDSRLVCERGILTEDQSKRDQCEAKVLPAVVNEVSELTPGEYVITTQGETVTTQCKGIRAESDLLESGVYHASIKPYCSLKGDAWKIEGLLQRQSKITVHVPLLSIKPLKLSFSNDTNAIVRVGDNWTPLMKLRRSSLPSVEMDDSYMMSAYQLVQHRHTPWFVVSGILLAVAAVAIGVLCKYKVIRNPFRRFGFPRDDPQTMSTVTLASAPVTSPTAPVSTVILRDMYPVLGMDKVS